MTRVAAFKLALLQLALVVLKVGWLPQIKLLLPTNGAMKVAKQTVTVIQVCAVIKVVADTH